jgi:hypothetical protein
LILDLPFDEQIVNFLNQLRAAGKVIAHSEVRKLNAIATYMRSQVLQDAYRIVPMKSAQNVISAGFAFAFGGATANDFEVIASPTMGAGGLVLNGTSQYGRFADFLAAETLTVFARQTPVTPTPTTAGWIVAQGAPASNNASFSAYHASSGNQYVFARSSLGTAASLEQYVSPVSSIVGTDHTLVVKWTAGAGRAAWVNKTALSLSLSTGSAQTARFNSSQPIEFGARAGASFLAMTGHALCLVKGDMTEAQQFALTDLINAL